MSGVFFFSNISDFTWIAFGIGTSVIELTTSIALRNVDFREVANTCNLNIFGCLDKVNAFESLIRDNASTSAGLGAVSDGDAFRVTNG